MMIVHGSCLCGSVKYQIEGEPYKFIVCHCSNCGKVTGSEAGHFVSVKDEQFTHTENPAGIISAFEDTKVSSGHTIVRRFCGKCGSTLFTTYSHRPGVRSVPYGGLDDAPQEWKPTDEVWCRNKKSWVGDYIPQQQH